MVMRYRTASMVTFKTLSLALCAFGLLACGGGETPEPKAPSDEAPRQHGEDGPSMSASADIGALDEAKVTSTFQGSLSDLQKCLAAGAERNELEGGDIGFFVKVGSDGKLVHAHAERSTLGDRETEKCMLRALQRRTWPAPVGGDVGLAHNSFSFDPPNDSRPPTAWDEGRVRSTVSGLSSKLDACKRGTHGDITATVYVDPDGAAISVGVAAADESGERAADCVAAALKDAKYPSPGSWPAKVTFPL
jgi:hypothetical protein